MIPSSHHRLGKNLLSQSAESVVGSPACKERTSSASEAYVYLLRSKTTGKFYVGWTTDMKRRLKEHNSGKSLYTKSRGPWELMGYETFLNSEAAKKRERALKRNPRMLFYFKKRALTSLLKGSVVGSNTQQGGMIPSPVYRPERPIPPLAEKQVMG